MPKYRDIKYLGIDLENPRLGIAKTSEKDALGVLFSEPNLTKMRALANDIVNKGGLELGSMFYIMKNPAKSNKFIVLEGNRRLATLKILNKPALLKGILPENKRRHYEFLSRKFVDRNSRKVLCMLVESREQAADPIESKHVGESGGSGVVLWGPKEKDRYKELFKKGSLAIQVIMWLEKNQFLLEDEISKIPSSTLNRLLQDPDVRDRLGLDMAEGRIRLVADEDSVKEALLSLVKSFNDDKFSVNTVRYKDQRLGHVEAVLSKAHISVVKDYKNPQPLLVESEINQSSIVEAIKISNKESIPSKIHKRKLIPRECYLDVTSPRIKKLEGEMRRLLVREYVNSSSVLLRLFIEMTINHYCENNNVPNISEKTQLNRKCMEVSHDLERKGIMSREQVKAMESYFTGEGFLKPVTAIINNYVHNKHHSPLVEDVISHWDNLEPLMKACWPIQSTEKGEM